MMRDAWFCYERSVGGRHIPVIYYDEPPKKSMNGKENTPDRIQVVKVPHSYLQPDGEYSLLQLQKLYPHPKVLQKETSSAIDKTINGATHNMSRPVSGYQTSQGQFFETEEEANLYEASYELDVAATAAVKEQFGDETPQERINIVADGIKTFIHTNEKAIREYLDARAAFTQASRTEDIPMDGQTAPDNPSDDTSVRSESDTRLEDATPTKAVSPRSGKKSASERDLTDY